MHKEDRGPCVAMTPWGNTPFQLISDFNQGFEHAEQTSSRGVLEEGGGGGGGGGNRLAKGEQASWFSN